MKQIQTSFFALLLTVLLPVLSVTAVDSSGIHYVTASSATETTSLNAAAADGYVKAAESGGRILYVDTSSANFYIQNTQTGLAWYANPPEGKDDPYAQGVYKMEILSSLLINVFDLENKSTVKKNSETACVRKGNAEVHVTANGFEAVYTFADEGITIPVQVTLEEGSLQARIETNRIKEEKKQRFLLSSVSLLPNFGAGGKTDKGYVLIPDGAGAIMRFNNGKFQMDDYAQPVYGRDLSYNLFVQPNVTEKIMLPVFGIQNGGQAFAAVITEGDTAGVIHAIPSSKNSTYAQGYTEFVLRSEDNFLLAEDTATAQTIKLYQTDVWEADACAIRYLFLEGDQANYVGMAKRYQQYLKDRDHLQSQGTDKRSLYLDFYGAVVKKKPFLGIPLNRTQSLSTIDEVSAYLQSLPEAIASGAQIRLMEWSKDALSGKVDTRLAPVSAVGSVRDIQALSDKLSSTGGRLYLGLELQRFRKGGNGFSAYFDGAKSFTNAPAYQYQFRESTRLRNADAQRYLLLNPGQYGKVLDKLQASVSRKGLTALSPFSIANSIYGSYGNSVSTRKDTQAAYRGLLQGLSDEASLLLDFPADYAFAYSDAAVNVPVGSSGFDVLDEWVPFYQLVLSGLRPYATRPVNLEVNPASMVLFAAETGASLHYSLITGDSKTLIDTDLNTLYSAEATVWKDNIEKAVAQLAQLDDAVQGSELVGHEIITHEVRVSVYANGTKAVVNYGNEPADTPWGQINAQSIVTVRG